LINEPTPPTQQDIEYHIFIPSGSYNGEQISKTINLAFNNIYNIDKTKNFPFDHIKCLYDSINGKIFFSIFWNEIKFYKSVEIDFTYIEPPYHGIEIYNESCEQDISFCQNADIYSNIGSNIFKDQLTLGWLLGFRGSYSYKTRLDENCCNKQGMCIGENKDPSFKYIFTNPLLNALTKIPIPKLGWLYFAESIYDPIGNRYFLLSINDYQNQSNRSLISPMQHETLNDGNLLAKLYAGCNAECCTENEDRIYFGPTEIRRLHIKLLDEFGRIVDLNNGDYSFTLEMEVLYDL